MKKLAALSLLLSGCSVIMPVHVNPPDQFALDSRINPSVYVDSYNTRHPIIPLTVKQFHKDDSLLAILQKVQDSALESHVYVTDKTQYDIDDYWELSLKGDCEDYALWIQQELKQYGIESDLVIADITRDGEKYSHVVVNVNGWIIDNRTDRVLPRYDVKYDWRYIGKPDGKWYKIKNTGV